MQVLGDENSAVAAVFWIWHVGCTIVAMAVCTKLSPSVFIIDGDRTPKTPFSRRNYIGSY